MFISSVTDNSQIFETIYGVAHSSSASIYGPAGYREFAKSAKSDDFSPVCGSYAMVRRVDDTVTISTDHFGTFRIYIYRSGDFWAISDSVQALVDYAKGRNLPVTPYVPAAYAFLLRQGVGQQISSFRTPVAEIELVPHWHDIVISDGLLSFRPQQDVAWTHDLSEANFEAARFFASLLNSFIEYGMSPFIRLSAGNDSRCTLAAMLSLDDEAKLSKIRFQTSGEPNFIHEQPIVLSLVDGLGFEQLTKLPRVGRTNWPTWKSRYLGAQSHFVSYLTYGPPNPAFTGASGELMRPYYSWGGDIENIGRPQQIPVDIYENVIADVNGAISNYGGQLADAIPVEGKHYQMFRNRFHFGRSFPNSVFMLPSLVYSLLANGTGMGDRGPMHRLIYEMGGEDLLRHRYDKEEKNFNGPLPKGARRIKIGKDDLIDRKIFIGSVDLDDPVTNLYGIPYRTSKVPSLIDAEFLLECDRSIRVTTHKGLITQAVARSAEMQLKKFRSLGDAALSGTCPQLMAALALGMCD